MDIGNRAEIWGAMNVRIRTVRTLPVYVR